MLTIAPAPGTLPTSGLAGKSLADGKHILRRHGFALRTGQAEDAESRNAQRHAQMHQAGIIGNQGGALADERRRVWQAESADEVSSVIGPREGAVEISIFIAQVGCG